MPLAIRTLVLVVLSLSYHCGLFAQVNLNSGLVAYYPFNGNANDESGLNHHPVFNNATLTEDRFDVPNSAYYFNGIDNHMRVPDAPDLNFTDQISIAVWVKPEGFYYGNCHGNSIIVKGLDTDPVGRYTIRFEDAQHLNGANCAVTIPDTLHQNYWAPGAFSYGGYTPYVQKDEWVSVIYTYDGQEAKLYINCELVISNTTNLSFTNPYDLFLGKLDSQTHPYWYKGVIDDVRLYNRALTEAEVRYIASDGDVLHTPLQTVSLPIGGSVKIGTSNPSSSYQWFPAGPDENSIVVNSEGLYIVETNANGCVNRDSFMVTRQTNAATLFNAPDTVCVNTPVQVSNFTNASSYYWNFCVSNINETVPVGTNLGNVSSVLRSPVFMDYVFFNGNYYGFVVNHNPGSLVRLDFGNSLLNAPSATNLGNFGGVIPGHAEGIQVVYNEGKWYAILVGGNPALGSSPSVLKIEFGADLLNPAPVAINWFNVGGSLDQPIDLHLFQEGTRWFGFTTNSENNTLTRFNFGDSFDDTPAGVDLGNVGGLLAYPTGVFAIDDNGFWRVFVVNGGNNTRTSGSFSLVRLDFGSSLLNTPTAVNLGNPGNLLQHPRDVTLMRLCGQVIGFAVNGRIGSDNLIKLNFSDDLTTVPDATDLGNIGSLSFPHSISKLFRVDDNLYTLITNVSNNTLTRLQFSGCTNSSMPGSSEQTPPPITYDATGTYNINLTVDDGLPTQSSYCRQVVVVPEPVHTPLQTIVVRPGESVTIGANNPSRSYRWFPGGEETSSITVSDEGLYVVETDGYGCSNRDSFQVVVRTENLMQFSAPDTVCVNTPVQVADVPDASSHYWSFCVSDIAGSVPAGVNLGNPGNMLRMPVFSDFVEAGGEYFVFVVNHVGPSGLVKLNFGNSLLNPPVATNLGNFNGILRHRLEGVQIVSENGRWYGFVVGGDQDYGDIPQLVRIDFGTNIDNPSPSATDLGDIGGMYQPLDLYMFKENGIWNGFTVNKDGSITRFEFSNGLNNTPVAQNYQLGLNYPTGVHVVNDNGKFYAFVTVALSNTIARLDFGNSLLNNPVIVDLGNPGNTQSVARDISILRFCGRVLGFVVNGDQGANAHQVVRLDFNSDIESIPTGTLLGNIGNLSFPHSLSKLFRVNDRVYSFVTNANNNTITRLEFSGCTNSSMPGSSEQVPPPVNYDTPGIYNINLTVDDGLPTQSSYCRQVVVVPEPVHTPLQTVLIRQGESIKIGTANPSRSYQWFPGGEVTDSITVSDEGLYIVATEGYGCSNIDSIRVLFAGADFSFEQDICNPLHVTFRNETPDATVTGWDFGNGTNAAGGSNPSIVYAAEGRYTVTLHTLNNTSGINESVVKEIDLHIQEDSIIVTPDTTICKDASLQLNAIDALSYCWTPAAGLSATDIANPVATPDQSIMYYLNALVTGPNLVHNGDFSSGNTAFVSGYAFSATNTAEGQYFVGTNPVGWNPLLTQPCGDRSGNGNMLMVKGESASDASVWSQTIEIVPNTNYAFSAWIQSLAENNPPRLMLSINGNTMGQLLETGITACGWTQFYMTWNSGDYTMAVIEVIDKSNAAQGGDFALDDIRFAPFVIKTDSVMIAVEEPQIVVSADTAICLGSIAPLRASGNFISYTWAPLNSLSDASINNPVAIPDTDTEYTVTGTTVHGCTSTAAVNVSVLPLPVVNITEDTEICPDVPIQLQAGGGQAYAWSPATGLSNASIANPVATPLVNTTYTVAVTGLNNCVARDSVAIQIRPYPVFNASADTTICEGSSVQLFASGGDQYQWTPAVGLSDPAIANPVAQPELATAYTLYIRENTCGYDTAMQISVNVSPTPVVSASRSNDINCSERTAQLMASGAVRYNWRPSHGLNNAAIAHPMAAVDTTTLYTVRGINEYGCFSEDTVLVRVTPEGDPLFMMPNAFTPNSDGVNDCLSLRKWGRIDLKEFSVYNRWGEKVFTTTNPNECWDGMYRGMPQPAGAFVYVVRAKTFCGDIDRKGTVTLIR